MSGNASDISQFCELEWLDWVMFWDEIAPFPDDVLKKGHYLGPCVDIGPAMTVNILTENEQVFYRSTYQPLTLDEIADIGSDSQEYFMARVYEKLGSWVLPRELEYIELVDTPQCDPYEHETQNKQTFS